MPAATCAAFSKPLPLAKLKLPPVVAVLFSGSMPMNLANATLIWLLVLVGKWAVERGLKKPP